jgi:hypothetical protein
MATLLKSGARKPLALGNVTVSFGMSCDVNNGEDGVTFSMNGADDKRYRLVVTNAELDNAIATRQRFGVRAEWKVSEKVDPIVKNEIAQDDRKGLDDEARYKKALIYAFELLRTHMPPTEQAQNITLGYIAAVVGHTR